MMWLMLYRLSMLGRKGAVGRLEAQHWFDSVSSGLS